MCGINDAGFGVEQHVVCTRLIVELSDRSFTWSIITLSCRAESFPYPQYQWQKYNTTAQMFEDCHGSQ